MAEEIRRRPAKSWCMCMRYLDAISRPARAWAEPLGRRRGSRAVNGVASCAVVNAPTASPRVLWPIRRWISFPVLQPGGVLQLVRRRLVEVDRVLDLLQVPQRCRRPRLPESRREAVAAGCRPAWPRARPRAGRVEAAWARPCGGRERRASISPRVIPGRQPTAGCLPPGRAYDYDLCALSARPRSRTS